MIHFFTQTQSIVKTQTFCTTHIDKNTQNKTFHNSIGGTITGFTVHFAMALEAELQGDRHILNTIDR